MLHLDTFLVFKKFNLGASQLHCDVSTGTVRPLVPVSLQRQVFQAVHKMSHPGIRATKRLLSAPFAGPQMLIGHHRMVQAVCKLRQGQEYLNSVVTDPEDTSAHMAVFSHSCNIV
jgi:hypothetical protein